MSVIFAELKGRLHSDNVTTENVAIYLLQKQIFIL